MKNLLNITKSYIESESYRLCIYSIILHFEFFI